jgi:P27 family predicted phage terminase small subunit
MGGTKRAPGGGRKAKPIERKQAAGNPGKRALNKAAPSYGKLVNVDAPAWLGDDARGMWETVVPLLCSQRVLEPTDLHNVEAFCSAYARWRDAEREVSEYGVTIVGPMGGRVKNPAVTVINEALRQLAMFGSLLGLDPSSRSRVMGGRPSKTDNPFSRLLGD